MQRFGKRAPAGASRNIPDGGLRRWNCSPGSWNEPHAQEPRDPSLRGREAPASLSPPPSSNVSPGAQPKQGRALDSPVFLSPRPGKGGPPHGPGKGWQQEGHRVPGWIPTRAGSHVATGRLSLPNSAIPGPTNSFQFQGTPGRGENRGRCSPLEGHIGDGGSEKTHVKTSPSTSRVIADAKVGAWRHLPDRGRPQSHRGHLADRPDISLQQRRTGRRLRNSERAGDESGQ